MQSQKRMFVAIMAVIVILGATALLVAKDNSMGVAKSRDITFSAPTVVAGTLLPSGEYKVLHEMQGNTHYMIFKQINGKAEVKAKCNLVPLTEKAKDTEQRYTENAKNERVLVEMTFRGDTAKHVLEP
jgi:hypothetical protein